MIVLKYLILIPDGMADRKIPLLENKTPMEAADKPVMDTLASKSICGTVLNVPQGMVPESDTANLAILSYNPRIYSKGRSPLEAVSMGLALEPEDTALRCNLVTLSEDEDYDNKTIIDHSSDEITTAEADVLVNALNEHFANAERHLYTGVSYRHCLIWKNADEKYEFMRPHDILGKVIGEYLPKKDEAGKKFYDFMRESYDVLNHHPINEERRKRGLRPANSAWLWSPGRKPSLPIFKEKWGLDASIISAVDLIKGIGKCAAMNVIEVEGATGNIHTNYKGKADAAIDAFKNGSELVYIHIEAPDECGHRGEAENKVKSIELIDKLVLKPVSEYLSSCGDDYKIMVLPDHPTPVEIRTHSSEPVPFFIYSNKNNVDGVQKFDEASCETKNFYIDDGSNLMKYFILGEL